MRGGFHFSNGARKYKLHKVVYESKQQERGVADFYTEMKSMWEELDVFRDFPAITKLDTEITTYIGAVQREEEEQHLFQFLNGIMDDMFGT